MYVLILILHQWDKKHTKINLKRYSIWQEFQFQVVEAKKKQILPMFLW